ncbi:MAG: glycosyltransferase family 4 protein [bacterium]
MTARADDETRVHVALVGPFPENRETFRGGVEAITYRLAEGLAREAGLRVDVVTLTENRAICGVADWGYRVTRLPASARFGNINFAMPDRRRLAGALREIGPQIVHAHSLGAGALGAIESGIPTVISIHGVIEREVALERGLKNRIRYMPRLRVVKASLARGRDFVIVSPYVANVYRAQLVGKRTYDLETSVDPLFFDVEPREEGLVIVQSGPVIPRKGGIDLVRAAPRIFAAHPAAEIRFAGGASDAGYKLELDRAIAERGLAGRVAFLGRLAPADLAREIGRAACVVLPSHQETAPIAIQEAMAAGRAVVASSAGGNPFLVEEGATGFIVPPGDPEALAARLIDVLRDAPRREAMGRRARELARARFEMGAVARGSVAIYERVLAAHTAAAS